MAASINDKATKSYSFLTKSLSSGINNTDTTIPFNNVTNIPTDTAVHFVIDRVDSNGNRTPTLRELCKGVVSGSNLINCTRGLHGTTAQSHLSGAVVEFSASAVGWNELIDAVIAEHSQVDGTHSTSLITSRTEDTAPDGVNDLVMTYDNSATALKKVKVDNLIRNNTQINSGWVSSLLPAVSSVTNNGNRSYDVTFASTVASYLTPGMRIRTSRTVASPTQCADLEAGSSQYFNDTSVSDMTFTDDFVVSAWVKLESYPGASATIASRYNGTSGWVFDVNSSGQVRLLGFNSGAANASLVTSYQSVPLSKWVHIAAQLDMSTFTATTTTSYIMLDGTDVPASVSRTGTNPTTLIQAGNLEIGATNGGTAPFDGKLAQVAIYSAKVTQANVRATISQGLSGSEASLVSAYSFNNSITDLNTTTPNDLTAQGSAVATNADSPFSLDANGTPGGTYDFGIVTKVATTVATVQVPEGCTIPTSGGVSAVDLGTGAVQYNFPKDTGRWRVSFLNRQQLNTASNATFAAHPGIQFTVPVGAWEVGWRGTAINATTTAVYWNLSDVSQTGLAATASDLSLQVHTQSSAAATYSPSIYVKKPVNHSTATTYTQYTLGATTSAGMVGHVTTHELFAEFALL